LVPTWGGVLYCLSLLTGELVWLCNLGAKSRSSPLVLAGAIWAGTYAGDLLRIDTSGELCGRYPLDRSGVADLCELEGSLLVVCLRGLVLRLSPGARVSIIWQLELGFPAFRCPLLFCEQGLLIFGSMGGILAARLVDGLEVWRRPGKEIYMPLLRLRMAGTESMVLAADASGCMSLFSCDGTPRGQPLELPGVPSAIVGSGTTAIVCLRSHRGTGGTALVEVLLEHCLKRRKMAYCPESDREGSDDCGYHQQGEETRACEQDASASEVMVRLVERWSCPLSSIPGLSSVETECHALHVLPGGGLLVGARDDFLHALGEGRVQRQQKHSCSSLGPG